MKLSRGYGPVVVYDLPILNWLVPGLVICSTLAFAFVARGKHAQKGEKLNL